MDPHPNHDIIVVGASAGGVDALRILLGEMPDDLPAGVFVVLHVGEVSYLASILDRASALPVSLAVSGLHHERAHVYVAPPKNHLLLHGDHMLVRRGPRENLARPAVDPLFRSAAASFGSRAIGVVLSGALSDGSAGLRAIKRCGGLAVVQEPADALVPQMPNSAIRYTDVDHVVPVVGMARLLAALARQPAEPAAGAPLDIRLEAAIAAQELSDMRIDDMIGNQSPFTCPECHGALWEIQDGTLLRYRCHVGHAFTAESMLASQADEIDKLLGVLLRSHQERAALSRHMAQNERDNGRLRSARIFDERAAEYEKDAELVRGLMRNRETEEVSTTSQWPASD